jgi:hypothetical protein
VESIINSNRNNYLRFCLSTERSGGSALILVVVMMVILSFLGVGMLKVAYGVRHNAIKFKNEAASMLAAEAAYEQAIFYMSQEGDMLSALKKDDPGITGALNLPSASATYQIMLHSFAGYRPVYRVLANGQSGEFKRTVDVLVVQAVSGWDMGKCRVPTGTSSTTPVYFVNGEVIDMPVHINDNKDSPDNVDIAVTGNPDFLQQIAMGESRYTKTGSDKYSSIYNVFDNGIIYDQPDNKITDGTTINDKISRFEQSTSSQYKYTPVASSGVTNPQAAVQLEFFVENGIGKIRITNDCTVRGTTANTYDYRIRAGTSDNYEKYNIYSYHYARTDANSTGRRTTCQVDNTYVTQTFNGVESEPGGQIYINGNVIIGSAVYDQMVVKGKITVVATGNIWIADSITLDGQHDADGMPSADNTNILGLVAKGVIKVVDPGLSGSSPTTVAGLAYAPVANQDEGTWVTQTVKVNGKWVTQKVYQPAATYARNLPQDMLVEAALTVGGGGWGAENVGSRKNHINGVNDNLILRGTITEAIRGVVGLGTNGYLKNYYFDSRVLEGILPGDIWLQGKYIPAPAGWHDYRPVAQQ